MKKSILNLGKALDKTEQKNVSGGRWANGTICSHDEDCQNENYYCCYNRCVDRRLPHFACI